MTDIQSSTSAKMGWIKEFLDTEQVPDLSKEEIEAIEEAGSKLHHKICVFSLSYPTPCDAINVGSYEGGIRISCMIDKKTMFVDRQSISKDITATDYFGSTKYQ